MLLHSSRCSVSYSSDRVAVRDRVLLNSNANHSLLAWDTRSLTKAFQKTGDIVARPAATKSEVDQSQLSDRGRTYVQDYSSLPANTVKLFQEYAHVPAAELERHIQHIVRQCLAAPHNWLKRFGQLTFLRRMRLGKFTHSHVLRYPNLLCQR